MDAGKLAPDDIVNDLVAERFRRDDRPERFVLDGYPRTVAQAAALDAVLREQFLNLTAVILLTVDDNEIVRRLGGRGRDDDRPEIVRARLVVYHNETEDLIPHYRAQGLLIELSGEGDVETVYNNIMKVLTPKVGPSC
jgi:adenylate kinase